MLSKTGLIALALFLTAQAAVLAPRGDDCVGCKCKVNKGGPSKDAKKAVMDFVKKEYIKDEVCPRGTGFVDDQFKSQCFICEDAYLGIFNDASDSANYCFTDDEFNKLMDKMPNGKRCTGGFYKKTPLLVQYGNVDDFTINGECHKC